MYSSALNLITLELGRLEFFLDLIMCYNIVFGLVSVHSTNILATQSIVTYGTRGVGESESVVSAFL